MLAFHRKRATAAGLRVRVEGGYHPETIYGRAGQPLAITFRREEDSHCSERVLFPSLGKSAMLPRGEDVVVALPPLRPGAYEFTCEMDMLRGRLVIGEDRR